MNRCTFFPHQLTVPGPLSGPIGTRNMTTKVFLLIGLFAAMVFGVSSSAEAFCVENKVLERIHVQALDKSRFAGDIRGNGTKCGRGAKGQKTVTLLIVTGYEPVSKSGRPGWTAQCRVQIPVDATVVVTGRGRDIACTPKR